jgi:hypothetical protein
MICAELNPAPEYVFPIVKSTLLALASIPDKDIIPLFCGVFPIQVGGTTLTVTTGTEHGGTGVGHTKSTASNPNVPETQVNFKYLVLLSNV